MTSPAPVRSLLVLAGDAGWLPHSGQTVGDYVLEVRAAPSLEGARAYGSPSSWDVVAFQLDCLRPLEGAAALAALRSLAPDATFLAVTAAPQVREALQYLKQGVYEYLEEPLQPETFLRSLLEAIENRDAFREILNLNRTLEAQRERLVEEKAELERKNAELEAVSRMARAVSSTLDLDEVLEQFACCIRETFGFDRIWVGVLDKKTACEEARAALGIPESEKGELLRKMRWHVREAKRQPWLHTVFREGSILRVDAPATHPQTRGTPLCELHGGAFVKIPMRARGHVVGSITVDNPRSQRTVGDEELGVLRIFADTAALAVENARLYESMRELSVRDELTGLYNRRHFLKQIDAEWSDADRHGMSLSVLMIDVDHFKAFNDLNDHLAGDDALRKVAGVLRRNTRGIDTVARYGGEEFIVILPRTSRKNALVVAEKLRSAVEKTVFEGEELLPAGTLTVSIGAAAFPGDAATPRELLERADLALYRAKQSGRNRVTPWSAQEAAVDG